MSINGIGVHVKVSDFVKSKKFYEDLGFLKVFEYGPDKAFQKDQEGNLVSAPEEYNGITFQHGGCKLEIADGHRAVKPAVFKDQIRNSKISLMVYVNHITEIIERCRKARISLAVGPRHYYWGTLEVVVKDPDGLVLVFISQYSPEEAAELHADETWGKPQ